MTDSRWQQPAHGVWTRTIRGLFYEINYRQGCYVVWASWPDRVVPEFHTLTTAKRAALKHAKENGK